MGHDFTFICREGLPVQPPDWSAPMDTPEWEAANIRYWNATPEARGHWSCAYTWSARLVQALTATGVLIAMEHGPWPAQVYVDEQADEPVPTPEGQVFLSQGAGRAFRVPSWKFDGNPWIFTPSECAWMAYALRPHPDPDIQAFGRFCELAAKRGGMMAG